MGASAGGTARLELPVPAVVIVGPILAGIIRIGRAGLRGRSRLRRWTLACFHSGRSGIHSFLAWGRRVVLSWRGEAGLGLGGWRRPGRLIRSRRRGLSLDDRRGLLLLTDRWRFLAIDSLIAAFRLRPGRLRLRSGNSWLRRHLRCGRRKLPLILWRRAIYPRRIGGRICLLSCGCRTLLQRRRGELSARSRRIVR
jgi:hypothetical protein